MKSLKISTGRFSFARIKFLLKVFEFIGIISIPHILNTLGFDPFIFSSYPAVVGELYENFGQYGRSFLSTSIIGGFAVFVSILFGVGLGVLAGYFSRLGFFFETLVKLIWSIPLIAFAVFLHLFIKSDYFYVVLTGVFLGAFPIVSFTYRKCIEPNEGIQSLVASFNLSRVVEFRYFRCPEVLRSLVVPLAQSVPLTFIGVTMGEFTVGGAAGADYVGLGSDFKFGMVNSIFPKVYISIFLMIFLVFFSGELFEFLSSIKVKGSDKSTK